MNIRHLPVVALLAVSAQANAASVISYGLTNASLHNGLTFIKIGEYCPSFSAAVNQHTSSIGSLAVASWDFDARSVSTSVAGADIAEAVLYMDIWLAPFASTAFTAHVTADGQAGVNLWSWTDQAFDLIDSGRITEGAADFSFSWANDTDQDALYAVSFYAVSIAQEPSAIPEPSPYATLGLGLLGLGYLRHRRQHEGVEPRV